MGRVVLLLMLGVFAIGAACSDELEPGLIDDSSDATEGPRIPTPNCSPGRPHTEGESTQRAAESSVEFSFIVYTPAAYDGTAPLPVVLNYHGAGSTPERQIAYSKLSDTAELRGFLLVSAPTGSPAAAVLNEVEERWCVDTARVFATGMSAGARFSSRLLCELPERIAAIAAVAGLDAPNESCDGSPPRPVIAFHGTADQTLVLAGASDAAAAWASHNGCARQAIPEPVSAHVTRISYRECASGADVQLFTVEGGGHTWPGAAPRDGERDGATTPEISANDLMWAFFVTHPLR